MISSFVQTSKNFAQPTTLGVRASQRHAAAALEACDAKAQLTLSIHKGKTIGDKLNF